MLEALQPWMAQNPQLLTLLGIGSLVMLIASLALLPWLAARIPADYFAHDQREPTRWKRLHPVFRLVVLMLKNAFGLLLLLAGMAMLVLPGQGLLSILLGLMLMDYPGKFQLERWIVSRPGLLRLINWLRRKRHRPPLIVS